MTWHATDNGTTIGTEGSERGTILPDEEHPDGARITLEREGQIAPWSITCGVYGLLAHTRFFADRPTAEAEYETMKPALQAILAQFDTAEPDEQGRLAQAFVEQFRRARRNGVVVPSVGSQSTG